ncbi:MAG: hypothetical protein WCJ02_09710 [bacterium]
MSDTSTVFITRHNATSIVRRIPQDAFGNLGGELYTKKIYCLGNSDKRRLLAVQAFFKDPKKFIAEYYVAMKKTDTGHYVFESGSPAYHCAYDCERLNSDYTNYEIPPQIVAKAENENDPSIIETYRNWFKANMYLLDSERNKFSIRFFGEFKFEPDFRLIAHPNSGSTKFTNLDLSQLEEKIDQLIISAAKEYHSNEIVRKWGNKYWLGRRLEKPFPSEINLIDETCIRNCLRQYENNIIAPLKQNLIDYYKVKYNPELSFEGTLLQQLGFIACRVCHSHQK